MGERFGRNVLTRADNAHEENYEWPSKTGTLNFMQKIHLSGFFFVCESGTEMCETWDPTSVEFKRQ